MINLDVGLPFLVLRSAPGSTLLLPPFPSLARPAPAGVRPWEQQQEPHTCTHTHTPDETQDDRDERKPGLLETPIKLPHPHNHSFYGYKHSVLRDILHSRSFFVATASTSVLMFPWNTLFSNLLLYIVYTDV